MTSINIVIALACSGLCLWLAIRWVRTSALAPAGETRHDTIALLFNGDRLHHISDSALHWFPIQPGAHNWDDLCSIARDQFATFPDQPCAHDLTLDAHVPEGVRGLSQVQIKRNGDMIRVEFDEAIGTGSACEPPVRTPDEEAAHTAPNPIWQTDSNGTLSWSNPAFDAISDGENHPLLALDTSNWREEATKRHRVVSGKSAPKWYDITLTSLGDRQIFHTQDTSALVAAEEAQRNFVQTLAKTFAHLSIGLAIFDRNQQLALFNPALVDLSGLDAEFLSARPTMLAFFDRLREARRMPEPKNYRSWRQEISEVIAAASDGRYQESWSLEAGQTFRVTGRPHPDGATAFLIEDISAEVTLTRNFRAELELGQVILDSVDEALAVFSSSAVLAFCNAAYRNLWSLDPDNSFADMTIRDNIAAWQTQCRPTGVWQQIESFAFTHSGRAAQTFRIVKSCGTRLHCDLLPVPSGETLIKFRVVSQVATPERRLLVTNTK